MEWAPIGIGVLVLVYLAMCIGVCREIDRYWKTWLEAEMAEMGVLPDQIEARERLHAENLKALKAPIERTEARSS